MGDDWPIDEIFDEDYLHFYAQRLTDEASDAEAALVWELLRLTEGCHVLDLACGHGRIANRLAGRGAVVTGMDATRPRSRMAAATAAHPARNHRPGGITTAGGGEMQHRPHREGD